MEPVREALKANLFLIAGALRPSMPFSKTKPRILPSHLHRAHTTKISLNDAMSLYTWAIQRYDSRNRRIRNPGFTAAKYERVSILFGGRFHSRRVRSMVWLCESKTANELALRYVLINKQNRITWKGAHPISASTSLSALEYQTH